LSVRVKLPNKAAFLRFVFHPASKIILIGVAALLIIALSFFAYYYKKYAALADEKLARGPIPDSSLLYAAPEPVMVGDVGTPPEIALRLHESGYREDGRGDRMGWYHLRTDAIEIFPGSDSYFESEPSVIRFNDGKVSNIISLRDNSPLTEYDLEPEILTNLFDKSREKRRVVRFNDIPPVLVNAVLSAEDKRFFQHSGFDPIRIVASFWVDLREMRRAEGASTITQQLARLLWLNNKKTVSRKLAELFITLHLERKLTKHQIFEYYANQVDLGRRGSFEILGFGEAAKVYFGKDISQLSLPESATLAGLIQNPSRRNPVRWPDRAKARRNVVLTMMHTNGYITTAQFQAAMASPLVISKQGSEANYAPYFVDLVNQRLLDDFQDRDFNDTGYKVYTTLDTQLQSDAMAAVASGYKEIETAIMRRHKKGTPVVLPQVALVALDPHTGEVKALVGGTNYTASQLNHATAERPSGSVFKPFVYATALETGLSGPGPGVITPSTIYDDTPRPFFFNGQPYQPSNFENESFGQIPVWMALAKSLNVPVVEIAESVGYQKVADLAHRAGLDKIKATPAMALGAYDVTPLDMAGAYTIFANQGVYESPRFIQGIHNNAGEDIYSAKPDEKKILDPRVNYILVNLMSGVLRSGTGANVRLRGFTLPAAGKTGTSHDGWFAGFTTKLLCVVWVGYDDYRDLKLQGAQSALPIWTDFMKKAHSHREYRDAGEFQVPDGVVSAQIDSLTGELATSACPSVTTEYYLTGTQPNQFCHLHAGGSTQVAGWTTPLPNVPPPPDANGNAVPPNVTNPNAPPGSPSNADAQNNNGKPNQPEEKKKKGFFDKLKGIFK
jgi:penicillin-binding protein 1B